MNKIVAVQINNRRQNSTKVQEVLTNNGCVISGRIGLHEAKNVCSSEGLIVLILNGKKEEITKLITELENINEVTINEMGLE